MLERIQERNEVELEIFNVQDTIDDHNAKAKTFDRQRAQIEERVENVSKKRRHDAASLYGPNFSRMDLYLKLLEDVVLTKERNKKQRQLRLEHIRNDLKKEKADEETIRKEIESTRKIIRNLQFGNVDEEANPCSILDKDTDHSRNGTISNILCRNKDFKEISDLSKRVQETIEQRSILRKKLNEAQQEYDNSNEEMLKWEEKHVEMAIKKNIADQVRN